jgi:hypothetical protein
MTASGALTDLHPTSDAARMTAIHVAPMAHPRMNDAVRTTAVPIVLTDHPHKSDAVQTTAVHSVPMVHRAKAPMADGQRYR